MYVKLTLGRRLWHRETRDIKILKLKLSLIKPNLIKLKTNLNPKLKMINIQK